jgi:hypothetical protein
MQQGVVVRMSGDTSQSFSKKTNDSNEKQSKKKSRAEYLREWRKNNPDNVKQHRRKADRKYYQKNSKKYLDREKINYHESCIIHAIPTEYNEWVDEKWADITADHEFFDSRYRPHNIWNHNVNPDSKQIEKNIRFVINLQNKNLIPKFLLYPLQTYLNRITYRKKYWEKIEEMHSKKDEKGFDVRKEWVDFDKKMNECFSKIANESYEKRLGLTSSSNGEKVRKQLDEDISK